MLDLLLPQRCVVCGCGGETALRRLPRGAAPARAAAVRALRRAGGVAGRALPGMCGPAARFASARAAVGYDAAARRLVTRGRSAGCGVSPSRPRSSSSSGCRRPRSTRSPSSPPTAGGARAWPQSGRAARLELAAPGSCRACRCSSGRAAAASAGLGGRAPHGPRCLPRDGPRAAHGRPDRRRLHDRRHRGRRRDARSARRARGGSTRSPSHAPSAAASRVREPE